MREKVISKQKITKKNNMTKLMFKKDTYVVLHLCFYLNLQDEK